MSIHNREEERFLAGLTSGTTRIWLNGRKTAGKWQWSDGTPWNYQNWAPKQPSGDGTCMELMTSKSPKWNDRGCKNLGNDMNFVCRKWENGEEHLHSYWCINTKNF